MPPSASPLPGAASPPKLSTKKASAAKAARLVAGDAPAPLAAPRSAAKPRNPLLGQELPRKLAALLDMFGERAGWCGECGECGELALRARCGVGRAADAASPRRACEPLSSFPAHLPTRLPALPPACSRAANGV